MNFDLPLELESARRVKVSRGEQVFRQGEACHNYYIALSGCIKVFARSPGGKEIVLYRVEPGDICVLTTSCKFWRQHTRILPLKSGPPGK